MERYSNTAAKVEPEIKESKMAIGMPLSPRYATRLHRPWRQAGTVLARPIQTRKADLQRIVSVTRVVWTRTVNGAKSRTPSRARARQRQRAFFIAFEEQYDRLLDLLCAAAHEGVSAERETAYGRTRDWMVAHYSQIEPLVRSYWMATGNGCYDPFQALFSYPRLGDAINVDTSIEDIMRSRAALDAYRAHIDGLPM
jgi:hypothetical protein